MLSISVSQGDFTIMWREILTQRQEGEAQHN